MQKMIITLLMLSFGVSLHADNDVTPRLKGDPIEYQLPGFINPGTRTEQYMLYMIDFYGDGWDGSTLDLNINGEVVATGLTVEADANSLLFDADNFDYLTTGFTVNTSYPGEIGYGIYDSEGYLLYDGLGNPAFVNIDFNPALTLQWTMDLSGENVSQNAGFESGLDTWGIYPEGSKDIVTTGDGLYNSEELFTAHAGDKSFKMWGLYQGNSENNVFHEVSGLNAETLVGVTFNLEAMLYSHEADFIGQGNSSAKIVAKYFGPGVNGEWWNDMLFMDESNAFDASSAVANTWTPYELETTVPAGVYLIQMGLMLVQPTNDDHGSVYADNLTADILEPVVVPEGIFFSEYAEGTSNNKYLEIYNGTGSDYDLSQLSLSSCSNGCDADENGNPILDYADNVTFEAGTIVAAGDVYVVAHGSSAEEILAEADQLFTYLSNGDDGFALTLAGATPTDYHVVDVIGDLGDDPGSGWAVAGVDDGTKEHTLVRKPGLMMGNMGDWAMSAGVDAATSEWIVLDQNVWTNLGSHDNEVVVTCDFTDVTLNLLDSYGDSWNGNVLTVGDLSFTLDGVNDDGVSASFDLCLEDAYYPITCGGGSYLSEVSWEMLAADGSVLLAGGAPYEGGLQVGEAVDVVGCMDPTALNYDALATLDDGSCLYQGYDCTAPLAATLGANVALSAPAWYTFTASLTGTATISSDGSGVDTQVYGYSGTCDALVEEGFGDDEGEAYTSIMVLDVVAGSTYYVAWTDYWSTDGFSWTLEEALYPVNPQNLTAEAGMDIVYLAWEGAAPVRSFIEQENEREARAEFLAEKKAFLYTQEQEVHLNSYRVNPDYAVNENSRTTAVTIDVGGGTWDSEISWTLTNAADGTEVAAGGAPVEALVLDLEDGSYILNAVDAYGDGWNGTFFRAYTETQVFLNWTLSEGAEGAAEFAVNDGYPNLVLSNLVYDQDTDALSVDVLNAGTLSAWNVDLGYYLLNESSAECNDVTVEAIFTLPVLDPEMSETFTLTGLQGYMGYGTFDIGVMGDYSCSIPESNEEDNLLTGTMTIVDPLEDITFTVYREDAASGIYTPLANASGLATEMFLDETVVGGTAYCYYVTQTDGNGLESGASNTACANPYGADAFPAPTALTGSATGYDVMLEWVAPDLTGWEPPRNNSRFAPATGLKTAYTPTHTESTPQNTRQGGDTFETATAIEALPYTDTGSTVGLVADYGPYGDLSGLVCEFGDTYYSATATGAGADAVYSIDLAEAAFVNVSLCGSGYDTGLGVFNSDGVLVAANDDFCTLQSEITCSMPAGMYYIVVSGYGASEGDYVLNVNAVNPPSPVAGYGVYRNDVNGVMTMVASVYGVDQTSFSEFIYNPEMPEGDTYSYSVTAYYDAQDVESGMSNAVDVTTTAPPFVCAAPSNLVAENEGNDVMLNWDAPEGGPSWFTHFDGVVGSGIGTATGIFTAEAAAKFGAETTLDLMGLSLTKVAFMSPDVTALFKIMVYDPVSMLAVDSTENIDPTTLVAGDWNIVELPNPVALDGSDVMFGYKVTVVEEGTYPMSIDLSPAVNGYGNLIQGFGTPFGSMLDLYGLDGNFAIAGYADYAEGRSIVALDPPTHIANQFHTAALESRTFVNSYEAVLPQVAQNRALLSFHIYRDGTEIGNVPVSETSYEDYEVAWGTHEYSVTALYNNTEDCGESAESNVVSLDLANNPPTVATLISPADNAVLNVTEANMEEMNMFIWTPSTDGDNDMVSYVLNAMTMVGEETLVVSSETNVLMNASFEENSMVDGSDWQYHPADWEAYPHMDNMTVMHNGDGMGYGAGTFESYEGESALKIWGLYNGEGTENNVMQTWMGGMLPPGTHFEVSAMAMSAGADFISGGNQVVVFAKYFTADWGWLGMDVSESMNAETATEDMWHDLSVSCMVPEGASTVQVGAMYVQSSNEDHGPVYLDAFEMNIPLTTTGFQLTNGQLAAPAMDAMVNEMTWTWGITSSDGYDDTQSEVRSFTVNISELLALDDIALPITYALHNNYPNPFNPVTNILYDIPEVSDVKLEIYNVMGQRVRTLAEGSHEAGRYQIVWNATNDYGEGLSSGMYIYRIQAGDFVSVKKLILMK